MKIVWIEDAVPGDWIKAKYNGHPFEGEAYLNKTCLYVGGVTVRLSDNTTPKHIEIVSIERPPRTLPTEPGSVIVDVVTTMGEKAKVAVLDELGTGWMLSNGVWHPNDEIYSFAPAKVVRA